MLLRSEITSVNPFSLSGKPGDLAFDEYMFFHETDIEGHVQVFKTTHVFLTRYTISNATEAFSCPSQYLQRRRELFEYELYCEVISMFLEGRKGASS